MTVNKIHVVKRDGTKQLLDIEKIHKVLTWACDGENDKTLTPIKGVSISDIEAKTFLFDKLFDGVKTSEIHEILIKSAAELIVENENYAQVAARLVWFAVRKKAYSQNIPPHLYEIVKKNVKLGKYDSEILDYYTEEEFNQMNEFVDHTRDDLFMYAAADTMKSKYIIHDKITKDIYESFQIPYILISAILFKDYDISFRMKYVKDFYDALSLHEISLPTPIMAGLRTPTKQFSSCTVIDSADSLDSIIGTAGSIVRYTSKRAGIGLNIGRIRAVGQPIRGGEAEHTGVFPFAKFFNSALKSCSQGGVRGGAGTFNYPIWHLETPFLIELKNNKGTNDTRLRTVDYCVHINNFIYRKLLDKEDLLLLSPNEVPELYEAFYSDDELFAKLYNEIEQHGTCNGEKVTQIKKVKTTELFDKVIKERVETGRIYLFNASNVLRQKPFYENVYLTNLCVEIALPTTPSDSLNIYFENVLSNPYVHDDWKNHIEQEILPYINNRERKVIESIPKARYVSPKLAKVNTIEKMTNLTNLYGNDDGGRVSLCTLAAINMGKFKDLTKKEEHEKISHLTNLTVRALDSLLDYQDYPVLSAHLATLENRSLGIGVINYAYFLAKNKIQWGEQRGLELTHKFMEHFTHGLIKASVQLAKEFGSCLKRNKYHDGIMPFDNAAKYDENHILLKGNDELSKKAKDLFEQITFPLELDWDTLREDAKTYGIRNATLTAFMPSETSSLISNSTNGIEPPRKLITTKQNKDVNITQVVPEYKRLHNFYQTYYEIKSFDYVKNVSVMQKFVDQSISANTSSNVPMPIKKEKDGNAVNTSSFLKVLLLANIIGVKTFYYHNTDDKSKDEALLDINNESISGNVDVGDAADDNDCGDACKI